MRRVFLPALALVLLATPLVPRTQTAGDPGAGNARQARAVLDA